MAAYSCCRMLPRKFRSIQFFLFVFLLFLIVFILVFKLYWVRDTIYLFRPVFDHKTDFQLITHYHQVDLNDSQLCTVHGWRPRAKPLPRVIDAVIFSTELDLLELRLYELWNVVDLFLVVEADRTFSGEPKSLLLNQNKDRFWFANEKLHIHVCNTLAPLKPNEGPFKNEASMRNCMTRVVNQYANNGDVVIMADVDEIPRQSTIYLFQHCMGYPSPIHLQLKTYFYSFEFFFSNDDSWRAKIQIYNFGFYYNHGKKSNYLLVDAGWHCTFCFRYIRDFRFKMTAYSHNDRLMGRSYLLEDKEIQHRICTGLDVFDMYPEVYTFRELFTKFGPISKTDSFVDVPRGLLTNGKKFSFLLKDGCQREDYHESK